MTQKSDHAEAGKKELERTIWSRALLCILVGFIVIGALFYFSGRNPAQDATQVVELDSTVVSDGTYPASYMIAAENRFDYQTGLECAAFSSAYVLRHYGEEADGMALFSSFPGKVSDGGVSPYGIEKFFNARGYEASFTCNATIEDLKRQVSKGAPVIVFVHVIEPYASTHNTHYLPLVGYDEAYLYFSESLPEFANCKNEKDVGYNRKTDVAKFKRLWANIDGMWDFPYFVITKKASV